MTAPTDGNLPTILRTHVPGHWQRVESAATSQGIPDCNYCIDGVEGWVECKQTHAWAVKVQPLQSGWIHRRTRAGGRVWIAVRRWQNTQMTDELWLVPGDQCGILMLGGLRGLPQETPKWSGGPRNWSWPSIRLHLTAE